MPGHLVALLWVTFAFLCQNNGRALFILAPILSFIVMLEGASMFGRAPFPRRRDSLASFLIQLWKRLLLASVSITPCAIALETLRSFYALAFVSKGALGLLSVWLVSRCCGCVFARGTTHVLQKMFYPIFHDRQRDARSQYQIRQFLFSFSPVLTRFKLCCVLQGN